MLILARFGWLPESGSLAWTCRGAIDFMGGAWLILAALGALLLVRSRDPEASDLKLWSVFLLTAWAISLLNPEITIVLPWAARRNLEFGSPLVALLAAGSARRPVADRPHSAARGGAPGLPDPPRLSRTLGGHGLVRHRARRPHRRPGPGGGPDRGPAISSWRTISAGARPCGSCTTAR